MRWLAKLFFVLCVGFAACSVTAARAAAEQEGVVVVTGSEAPAASAETAASGTSIGAESGEDDQNEMRALSSSVRYNGKKLNLKGTPLATYSGVVMVSVRPVLCGQGPKAEYTYNDMTGHVRIVRENKLVTFYTDDNVYYADGVKKTFSAEAVTASYAGKEKTYLMAPLEELCAALGISVSYNEDTDTFVLKGKKVTFSGKKIKTAYAYSMKAFARKEYRATRKVSYQSFLKLVNPAKDTTRGFQFLRIDRYRSVNKKKFRTYYQYLIRDYCREIGIRPAKSSLYGKADVFLRAAKKYNLDPIYLVNQTFLESAYGTSELASGSVIRKVARRGYPRTAAGKFKTKKIKKKVKVYNLYGIKAYDADPFVGGTSYAYYKKWTTVNRAIYGAAKYLRSNYVHRPYRQNTLFKMRYTFRANIWHQYATSAEYAQNVGHRMYLMSCCYSKDAKFLYDYPKYK